MSVLNFNQCIIAGNVTADPEVKITKSGKKYCSFRLAVNRRHLSADMKAETDYIPCVVWEKLAEHFEKYFKKGSNVQVRGEIRTGQYKDKDGSTRSSFEVTVLDIFMVEPPEAAAKRKPPIAEEDIPAASDDLPF